MYEYIYIYVCAWRRNKTGNREIQMPLLFLLPCFYSMRLKKSTLDIAIALCVLSKKFVGIFTEM